MSIRRILLSLWLILLSLNAFSQHNLLNKTQEFIIGFYKFDPEYVVTIDTISDTKALITCKSINIYPYYTYEIDLVEDRCTSFGFVSKNSSVLESYIEVLGYLGTIVKTDSIYSEFIYKVSLKGKKVFYTIKQPYIKSNIKTRKDIFYIMVNEIPDIEKK